MKNGLTLQSGCYTTVFFLSRICAGAASVSSVSSAGVLGSGKEGGAEFQQQGETAFGAGTIFRFWPGLPLMLWVVLLTARGLGAQEPCSAQEAYAELVAATRAAAESGDWPRMQALLSSATAAHPTEHKYLALATRITFEASSESSLPLRQVMLMESAAYARQLISECQPLTVQDQKLVGRLAIAMNAVGHLRRARCDYGKAGALYEEAAALFEKASSKYDRFRASCLTNLAATLRLRGDFAASRLVYERAIPILARKQDGSLAVALTSMGRLLESQGDYGPSEQYYKDAVRVFQRSVPDHQDYAIALHNLGGLYESIKNYESAHDYYARALQKRREYTTQDDAQAATILSSIGMLLTQQGEYAEARRLHEEVLEIRTRLFPESAYPSGHDQIASTLDNLGELMWSQGEYQRAEEFYVRALEMRRKLYSLDGYPSGHPKLADSLEHLAQLHQAQQLDTLAVRYASEAFKIRLQLMDTFLLSASEAEGQHYAESMSRSADQLLSVPWRTRREASHCYGMIWNARRLIQRKLALRVALAHQYHDEQLGEYLAVRRDLGRLLLAAATDSTAATNYRVTRIEELSRRKERLERDLGQAVAGWATSEKSHSDPGQLSHALPVGNLFVDVIQYLRRRHDPDQLGRAGRTLTRCYVAFVTAAGQRPFRIELGDTREIDQYVEQWRSDIGNGFDHGDAPNALCQRLWAPIAKAVPQDATTIYFCCDGAAGRLPWAALPTPRRDSLLLDKYAIAVVPSGHFLLTQLESKKTAVGVKESILLVGDVDYGSRSANSAAAVNAGARSIVWPNLAGTRREIERIGSLVGEGLTPTILRGQEATASRVLHALPAARWAHIATHGFFADRAFRSTVGGSQALFNDEGSETPTRIGGRNPLSQSGLVLAGANTAGLANDLASAQVGAGLLTAEAIAGLPLEGMQLAVLSACETVLGVSAGGEGVYGLQRAFHSAGAKNVVASLWKVEDRATRVLMELFYRELWEKGRSPLQALRQAQLTLYHDPQLIASSATERGPNLRKVVTIPAGQAGESTSPIRSWAGFVLSGVGD